MGRAAWKSGKGGNGLGFVLEQRHHERYRSDGIYCSVQCHDVTKRNRTEGGRPPATGRERLMPLAGGARESMVRTVREADSISRRRCSLKSLKHQTRHIPACTIYNKQPSTNGTDLCSHFGTIPNKQKKENSSRYASQRKIFCMQPFVPQRSVSDTSTRASHPTVPSLPKISTPHLCVRVLR